MSKYFEYNPDNGVTEVSEYHEDGRVTVYQQEDVTGVIDRCRNAANQGLTDHGIKKGFWHYASLPTTVCYELMKKGLNPLDKNTSPKALEREIDRNYPHFKTTSKRAT